MDKAAVERMFNRDFVPIRNDNGVCYELQHNDAQSHVRQAYNHYHRYFQKLLIMSGNQNPWEIDSNRTETNDLDLPPEWERRIRKYLVPLIDDIPDWPKINRQLVDPDICWSDTGVVPYGFKWCLQWIPWIMGKYSPMPSHIVDLYITLHKYIPTKVDRQGKLKTPKGRHVGYMTKRIYEIMECDATWIPCAIARDTVRHINHFLNHAMNDIGPDGQFKFTELPPVPARDYVMTAKRIFTYYDNDIDECPDEEYITEYKRFHAQLLDDFPNIQVKVKL